MKQTAATSSFGCIIQLSEVRHKDRSIPARNGVFVPLFLSIYLVYVCVHVQICIRCGYVGGGCSLYKYVACINWTHTHIHYSIRWYIQKS